MINVALYNMREERMIDTRSGSLFDQIVHDIERQIVESGQLILVEHHIIQTAGVVGTSVAVVGIRASIVSQIVNKTLDQLASDATLVGMMSKRSRPLQQVERYRVVSSRLGRVQLLEQHIVRQRGQSTSTTLTPVVARHLQILGRRSDLDHVLVIHVHSLVVAVVGHGGEGLGAARELGQHDVSDSGRHLALFRLQLRVILEKVATHKQRKLVQVKVLTVHADCYVRQLTAVSIRLAIHLSFLLLVVVFERVRFKPGK